VLNNLKIQGLKENNQYLRNLKSKTMKKLTLLLVAALMITGGAFAQDKPCCKKKGGHCTKSEGCNKDKKDAKKEDSKDAKASKQDAPKKA
jgi:hypothetical protein